MGSGWTTGRDCQGEGEMKKYYAVNVSRAKTKEERSGPGRTMDDRVWGSILVEAINAKEASALAAEYMDKTGCAGPWRVEGVWER